MFFSRFAAESYADRQSHQYGAFSFHLPGKPVSRSAAIHPPAFGRPPFSKGGLWQILLLVLKLAAYIPSDVRLLLPLCGNPSPGLWPSPFSKGERFSGYCYLC